MYSAVVAVGNKAADRKVNKPDRSTQLAGVAEAKALSGHCFNAPDYPAGKMSEKKEVCYRQTTRTHTFTHTPGAREITVCLGLSHPHVTRHISASGVRGLGRHLVGHYLLENTQLVTFYDFQRIILTCKLK